MDTAQRERLESLFHVKVASVRAVGGGSIAQASCVRLADGRVCFVKSLSSGQAPFLEEARGLRALREAVDAGDPAVALTIPKVWHVEADILVLGWIEAGRRGADFGARLGRGLAAIHRVQGEAFGFVEDNVLGSSRQPNTPQVTGQTWASFYWEKRLAFQWELAESQGQATSELRALMERLEGRLPSLLAGTEEPPCLIHGDLWGGNVMADAEGRPCLIDPAVYYGHREAELGMTTLFGGFGEDFYRAYEEAYPLPAGYRERLGLYELYHVLNHMNMFGGGYTEQAIRLLRRYV